MNTGSVGRVEKGLRTIGDPTLSLAAVVLLAWAGSLCFSRQAAAQAGTLDPAFGKGGIFSVSTATFQTATSVALQSDGKILVAGTINNLPGVLRLNSNGTPDTGFGTGGAATSSFNNNASGDVAVGVVVQTDGKIVIAASDAFADNGNLGFLLARFNTNGSPDTTFGNGGTVVTSPFNQFLFSPTVIVLQPDGMIVVAGSGVMARYQTNGQLDPTFGTDGITTLTLQSVTAIALQAGKILIASGGAPFLLGSPTTGAIARYNSNGSLDTTFGSSGQAACLPSGTAIVVQSTGKIVVAGSAVSRLVAPTKNLVGFGLTRFNPNSSLDATFGTHGTAITAFTTEPVAVANALAQQANGDIVAAGATGTSNFTNPVSVFALARYSATGRLDPTFGSGGRVTTAPDSGLAAIAAMAVQSDGKIVVVGSAGATVIVARYLGQLGEPHSSRATGRWRLRAGRAPPFLVFLKSLLPQLRLATSEGGARPPVSPRWLGDMQCYMESVRLFSGCPLHMGLCTPAISGWGRGGGGSR